MASPVENQIEAQKRRIEVLDERIGRLMSQRVDLEDKLAALYQKQSAPSRLDAALKTIMTPGFGA